MKHLFLTKFYDFQPVFTGIENGFAYKSPVALFNTYSLVVACLLSVM